MPDNTSQPFRGTEMSEIKRYANECFGFCDRRSIMVESSTGEYMRVSDHEQVVAELLHQLAAKDERIAKLQTEVEAHQLFGCPKHETIPSARNGSDWLRSIEKSHPDLTDDDRLHLQHVADGFDNLCQMSGEQEAETAHLKALLREICPYDHSDTFKSPPTDELRRALWKDIREALK